MENFKIVSKIEFAKMFLEYACLLHKYVCQMFSIQDRDPCLDRNISSLWLDLLNIPFSLSVDALFSLFYVDFGIDFSAGFLSLEEKITFRLSLGSILQKLFQNMSVCCINYVCQMFSKLQYFFEAVFLAKYVSLHNLPLYEQLCGENGITHHNIFFSGINR